MEDSFDFIMALKGARLTITGISKGQGVFEGFLASATYVGCPKDGMVVGRQTASEAVIALAEHIKKFPPLEVKPKKGPHKFTAPPKPAAIELEDDDGDDLLL